MFMLSMFKVCLSGPTGWAEWLVAAENEDQVKSLAELAESDEGDDKMTVDHINKLEGSVVGRKPGIIHAVEDRG